MSTLDIFARVLELSVCVNRKGPPVIRVNKYYLIFYFFAQYDQYKERYFFFEV